MSRSEIPTHALTLRAHWAFAVARLGKDVENRSWMPPHGWSLGTRIAIHAGAAYSDSSGNASQSLPAVRGSLARISRLSAEAGGPVATVHPYVVGRGQRRYAVMIEGDRQRVWVPQLWARTPPVVPNRQAVAIPSGAIIATALLADVITGSTSPWAFEGEHHWLLEDVRLLPEPIPAKGKLKLWGLTPGLRAEIRRQLRKSA